MRSQTGINGQFRTADARMHIKNLYLIIIET